VKNRKPVRGTRAISYLVATIILIAICLSAGFLSYIMLFSVPSHLSSKGQVTVEAAALHIQTDGQTAFTVTIKNTGGKPVSALMVNLAGTDYAVSLPSNGLQPGQSVSHVETNPTPPSGGFIAGNSYLITVKATFADGSTFSKIEAVKCMGSGGTVEQGEYTVTFTQTGLPSGTRWTVIFGGRTKFSTGSSITFKADEGTYEWSVQPADASGIRYAPSLPSGNMEVPTQTSQEIEFSISQYRLSLSIASGSGSIHLNPESSDGYYDVDAVVSATAVPEEDFEFDYWELDGSDAGSANPISVTMDGPHALNAYFSEVEEAAWLEGWSYRKSHVIEGSTAGAQTDYQVEITVHYGSGTDSEGDVFLNGKCRSDFGDIRFTSSDGLTLLDYWMETKVDSDYAAFWVEIPSIPASPDTTTIYVYYGKSDETSMSDGEATFPLFDDFNSLAGWTVEQGNGGSVSISNSILSCTVVATDYSYARLYRDSFGLNHAVRMRANFPPPATEYYKLIGFADMSGTPEYWKAVTSDNLAIIEIFDTEERIRCASAGSPSGTAWDLANDQFRTFEARRISGKFSALEEGGTSVSHMTDVPAGSLPVVIAYESNTPPASSTLQVDWMLVRKYVDPEPSHGAWGEEESSICWLEGWTYRKSHEIEGSTASAVLDYQVRITVYYGSGADSGEDVYLNGKCRSDFGDVRFTSDDGANEIPYWIEEKVDGDHAVFWVKVPSKYSSIAQ